MWKNVAMILLGNIVLSGCWLDNTPVRGEKPEPIYDSVERFHDRSDEESNNPGIGGGRR